MVCCVICSEMKMLLGLVSTILSRLSSLSGYGQELQALLEVHVVQLVD